MPTLSELTANPDAWDTIDDEHKKAIFLKLLTFYNLKKKGGREGARREVIAVAEKRERAAAAAKGQDYDPVPEDYKQDCCAARVRRGNTVHFSQCSKTPGGAWANTHPECQLYCGKHAKEMFERNWLRFGDVRVVGPGSFDPIPHLRPTITEKNYGNWVLNRETFLADVFEDTREQVEQENYPAPAKGGGLPRGADFNVWGKQDAPKRRVVVPEVVIHEEADLSDSEDEEVETASEDEFEPREAGGGIYEGVPLYVKKYLMGSETEDGMEAKALAKGFRLRDEWKRTLMEMLEDGSIDADDEEEVLDEVGFIGREDAMWQPV